MPIPVLLLHRPFLERLVQEAPNPDPLKVREQRRCAGSAAESVFSTELCIEALGLCSEALGLAML